MEYKASCLKVVQSTLVKKYEVENANTALVVLSDLYKVDDCRSPATTSNTSLWS